MSIRLSSPNQLSWALSTVNSNNTQNYDILSPAALGEEKPGRIRDSFDVMRERHGCIAIADAEDIANNRAVNHGCSQER